MVMADRVPLFKCYECGKLFYTVKSARRAAFGEGCPKCKGTDIDLFVPKEAKGK